MNIFFLARDPEAAAEYHIDRHVTKMMVEYAQILSTVWHIHWPSNAANHAAHGYVYRPTHRNHPSVKWAADNPNNYAWLVRLWQSLHEEYQFRYGGQKFHMSYLKCHSTLKYIPHPECRPARPGGLATFAPTFCDQSKITMASNFQAVGDFKRDDPVDAYRLYYRSTKTLDASGKPMAIWTKRGKPEWF